MVIKMLKRNKIYINLKKCNFLLSNVELLGFIVGVDGIELLSSRYNLLENGICL